LTFEIIVGWKPQKAESNLLAETTGQASPEKSDHSLLFIQIHDDLSGGENFFIFIDDLKSGDEHIQGVDQNADHGLNDHGHG
jgi:hypothetical protein